MVRREKVFPYTQYALLIISSSKQHNYPLPSTPRKPQQETWSCHPILTQLRSCICLLSTVKGKGNHFLIVLGHPRQSTSRNKIDVLPENWKYSIEAVHTLYKKEFYYTDQCGKEKLHRSKCNLLLHIYLYIQIDSCGEQKTEGKMAHSNLNLCFLLPPAFVREQKTEV